MEFFNHLAIIFTHYKEKPTKKDIARKETKTNQIIKLIKDIIGMLDDETTFTPYIYELDTDTDDNDNFIPKFQATIDIILLRMQTMVDFNGSINVENIKYNGVKDRLKEEKEKLEQIRKEFEMKNKILKEREENNEKERIKNEEDRKKNEEEEKRLKNLYNNISSGGCGWGGYDKINEANKRNEEIEKKKKEHEIKDRMLNELKEEKNRRTRGILTTIAGIICVGVGVACESTGAGAFFGVPLMLVGYDCIKDSNKKISNIENKMNNIK